MRTATLLFYGLATFFLGSISVSIGGANVLAAMLRAPIVQSGFGPGSYPTEPYQSILMGVILAFTVLFFFLAVLATFRVGAPPPPPNPDYEWER